MAPHDTDTPKEVRRHAVPLIGIALAVLFGFGVMLWWLADVVGGPDDPPAATAAPATAPPAE